MSRPHFRLKAPYPWYDAYMSALFETETAVLEARINEAEQELGARERDLLRLPGCTQERNALIAALRALKALRCCNGLRDAA